MGIVLLVVDDAGLDGLAGQRPFDEDGLALMTADADTVVIQTVYRKFNTLGLGGFLLGLENWAIKLGAYRWLCHDCGICGRPLSHKNNRMTKYGLRAPAAASAPSSILTKSGPLI